MTRRVEEFIRENKLCCPGDRILAAVSGGADSVCLLYVLVKLQKAWGFKLRVIHVNHQLRGREADRDEDFVRGLCKRLSVEFTCKRVEVKALARKEGLSEEEAGRILRYQVFEEEALRWEDEAKKKNEESPSPVRIAVAHHKDDDVETVLFQLFRGSGLKGLGGIPAARGRIIRPLLAVSREEILDFLSAEGLDFCVDSTNDSGDYTRNRLRHEIIPQIEALVNLRAGEHVLQTARRARQADAYLEEEAGKWLEKFGIREEKTASGVGAGDEKRLLSFDADEEEQPLSFGADAEKLKNEPEILQTYVIKQMMGRAAGRTKDLGEVHVEAARRLLHGQVGKQIDLPYGLTARRGYTMLWVEKGWKAREKNVQEEEIFLPKLEIKVFSYEKAMEIPQNQYTKWFDCDRIKGTLSVRTRQTGDYFFLPGGGKKTVKSYMVDEKIPAGLRGRIPLLADGSHILWIIGKRISEGCKVTDKTKTILQVHVRMADEITAG